MNKNEKLFKKQHKKLYKYFNRLFKKELSTGIQSSQKIIDHILLYAKYKCTFIALTLQEDVDILAHPVLLTAHTAISEYSNYEECWKKYYTLDVQTNTLNRIDSTKTPDEVKKEYETEQTQHLSRFWTAAIFLTRGNIEKATVSQKMETKNDFTI